MAQNQKQLRAPNMKQRQNQKKKKKKPTVSWETLDENGGSWADIWKPRVWEYLLFSLVSSSILIHERTIAINLLVYEFLS